LCNLGLPELAARTDEDFIRIAVDLALDLPRLSALRAGLRSRMEASPLMDGARFARNLEAAYRQMWRRWCHDHSG
jgi:predicted O-linked N-acetylglucosamine transferase (SPINDLY family)